MPSSVGGLKIDAPPEDGRELYTRLLLRFLSHVETRDGCWVWTGAVNSSGYGTFGLWDGKKVRCVLAHRMSMSLFGREMPPGTQVDHLCRNTRCVDPAHLEAVEPRVNVERSRRKRR